MSTLNRALPYKSLLNKNFILLCLSNFLMIFAQRMTNSVLSLYSDSIGATGVLTGLLSSAFTITALLLVPFSGQIVNHYSKKTISIIGIVIIAVATYGFSISTTIESLIVFRLLQGIGLAFTGISCLTLVAMATDDSHLSFAIAYYSICASIAQAIGPQVGLILGNAVGYTTSFKIEALILLSIVFYITLLDVDQKSQDKFKLQLGKIIAKEAILPAILIMLVTATNFTITSFITLYGKQLNISEIGWYFTFNAIALTITRPISDRIQNRIGNIKLLTISLICLSTSLVIISCSKNIFTLLLGSLVNAFGYGVSLPIIESICLLSVDSESKALASATNNVGSNLGILLGPIIAGEIRDVTNYSTMFLAMSSFGIIAMIIALVFKNKLKEINKKGE